MCSTQGKGYSLLVVFQLLPPDSSAVISSLSSATNAVMIAMILFVICHDLTRVRCVAKTEYFPACHTIGPLQERERGERGKGGRREEGREKRLQTCPIR